MAVAGGIAAYLVSYGAQPAYRNPVLANDAPDPSVIRAPDGMYYAYTTQAYFETKFVNTPILRSADLVGWELVGDAFPENPAWAAPSPGDMWAPHISAWNDGTYRLYFSASRRDGSGFGIGVATSDSPAGPFSDSGGPLVAGASFGTIDPFVLRTDDGKHYLYWGSDGQPISAQELSDDGLKLIGDVREVLQPSTDEYEGLIEGAWVTQHDGFYYLMYSGDACCGPEAHYAVMAARSRSPFGPWERDPDNPILAANEMFNAPGHNSTIHGPDGDDWMLYHAMVREAGSSFRYLFLDRIQWVDGWPVVNHGAGPTSCSSEAPDDLLPRLAACLGD